MEGGRWRVGSGGVRYRRCKYIYGDVMVSGRELTTIGLFFLFSSRLSDIEVKISFDLEVCFLLCQ